MKKLITFLTLALAVNASAGVLTKASIDCSAALYVAEGRGAIEREDRLIITYKLLRVSGLEPEHFARLVWNKAAQLEELTNTELADALIHCEKVILSEEA